MLPIMYKQSFTEADRLRIWPILQQKLNLSAAKLSAHERDNVEACLLEIICTLPDKEDEVEKIINHVYAAKGMIDDLMDDHSDDLDTELMAIDHHLDKTVKMIRQLGDV